MIIHIWGNDICHTFEVSSNSWSSNFIRFTLCENVLMEKVHYEATVT